MLVECVPNFSEGRRRDVIDAIADAALSVRGVGLLDVHVDPDHDRSVLTLAGPPAAVAEAAFRAVAKAVETIDLTKHAGVHPRIGAADVVPFIPLEGTTMEDARALAVSTGERIADELGLPVFLYGEAARRSERADLAKVRNVGFEALLEKIATDEHAPDLGPRKMHATAGGVCVGARFFLVAWNVDLDTEDLDVAKAIAREVRASSGGLDAVKALAFPLAAKKRVQVSMNLVDYRRTSIARAFLQVEKLARERGVRIHSSELVGLVPAEALEASAGELLRLEGIDVRQRVLERRLEVALPPSPSGPIGHYLDAIASDAPSPGGGSAGALSIALASACLEKALAFAKKGNAKLSPVELAEIAARHAVTRARATSLAQEDERAFADWMRARARPKDDPARAESMARATRAAIGVGRAAIELALAVARDAAALAERGSPHLLNDAAVAAELALAAARGARWNLAANASKDAAAKSEAAKLLTEIEAAAAKARAIADGKNA